MKIKQKKLQVYLKHIKMKKKAVSPLVAWVLLIGFTIGVGVLVSNFIIKQTEKTFRPEELAIGSLYCGEVAFTVDSYCRDILPNNPEGWGLLKLSLKNRGAFTITKIGINLKDDRGTVSDIVDLSPNVLKPGDEADFPIAVKDKANIDSNKKLIGTAVEKITLTPIILEEGRNVSCGEKRFIITNDMLLNIDAPCKTATV